MIEILTAVFCLLGCLAVLLAAVGVARFPDFFSRAHAATKASAFGLVSLMAATFLTFPSVSTGMKMFFALFALFLTLPVASQALAHAARSGKVGKPGTGKKRPSGDP